jgi:type II secretory pathway pseudopilin PulG
LRRPGFSLLESLICLSLFLFIFLSALQIFTITRDQFGKLRDKHESEQAVLTALEKIRLDLQESGRGLTIPSRLGLLTTLEAGGGHMTLIQADSEYSTPTNLAAGQNRITLSRAPDLRKNHRLCLFNRTQGEVREVLRIQGKDCILKEPLQYSYSAENTTLIKLKKTAYYLDANNHILRRKVNAAPAQPMLEDTAVFLPEFNPGSNLIRIQLSLIKKKENIYVMSFYPKNISLAGQM